MDVLYGSNVGDIDLDSLGQTIFALNELAQANRNRMKSSLNKMEIQGIIT